MGGVGPWTFRKSNRPSGRGGVGPWTLKKRAKPLTGGVGVQSDPRIRSNFCMCQIYLPPHAGHLDSVTPRHVTLLHIHREAEGPRQPLRTSRASHRTHTSAGESGAGFGRSGQAVSGKCEGWSRGAGLRTGIDSLYAACDENTAKPHSTEWLAR